MVSKSRPRALPGLATSNYFAVLASMDVEIEDFEVVANPAHGKRIQIIPGKAQISTQVATSKEAATFIENATQRSKKRNDQHELARSGR